MATIQWRPEVNALTTPQSYKMRFLPRASIGMNELAAEIAEDLPGCTEDMAKSVIASLMRRIQTNLINGNQVTLEDAISFGLSFTGRLDAPDSPLPPMDKILHVKARVSAPFLKEIRHKAQLERLPMTEKAPVINTTVDTRLHLKDVLYGSGVFRLTGSNMFFDPEEGTGECVLEGSRSGRAVQTQFGPISNSSIVLVPNIPAQDAPFNNEYLLSLAIRYTENGTLRHSIYRNRLRSPLLLTNFAHPNPPEVGILTGNATSPLVNVTKGAVSADEMLRIQAILDNRDNCLLLSLLDMKDGGQTGPVVMVTADGEQTLQGFAGSAISSLTIRVDNYAGLTELARNYYHGRVVDILDVRVG